MEVILREEIRALGKAGDVVKVSPGYGRNFLLPKKLAVLADPKNLKELEHNKRAVQARMAKLKVQAAELGAKLGAVEVTIKREAGEEDKLFGAVTAKDILEALRKENFVIEKRQLYLESPIKQLGLFEVPVKLHPEVTTTVKVWVVKM